MEKKINQLLKKKSQMYGNAKENLETCAELWTFALKKANLLKENKKITPELICLMMILFKINRQLNKYNIDNIIDIQGYAEILKGLK